jgi:hypothetical protein
MSFSFQLRDEAMAISDQESATIIHWLGGRLKKNSEEEREAMRAMARLLREERLPRDFRFALAAHFDPDLRDTLELGFVLEPTRIRGRPAIVNERKVAVAVWRRIEAGDQKKAAYQSAADAMGVSYRTAEKAFARWEEHLRGPWAEILTRID